MRKKRALRWSLTAAAVLWMGVIFYMSSKTGAASNDLSSGITGAVQRIFLRGWNQYSGDEFTLRMECLNYLIRKAAHFTEYAILGGLISAALYQWFPKFRVSVWFSCILGMLYAVSDEFHQSFVDDRSMQVFDVCIDTAGVLVGALVICGIIAMAILSKNDNNY